MIYFNNIGFYKANMKFTNLRKILTKAKNQHKRLFVALSGGIFLILLYLVGVVFGVDQFLINTPFEGKITSKDGTGISEAEVMIQGRSMKTDNDGYFRFEDVNFGTFDIVVDKNGYVRYSDKVQIRRFSNFLDISMRAQEYGEAEIIFKARRALDKNINVKINNQLFPAHAVNDEFVVETGRLLVGNYLLEVSSPDFIDFNEKFDLPSGSSGLVYNLNPSADLVAEVRDYLTENIIEPEEISITSEGEKIEVPKSATPGKFELKDISLNKEYKITLNLTDYLSRDVLISPHQGLNSLGNVYMFVDDTVIYAQKNLIVSSYTDGSNYKELYRANNNCRLDLTKDLYILFSCGSNFLLFKQIGNDYALVREYIITGSAHDLNVQNLNMILIGADFKSILQMHSTINTTVLYTHTNEVNSVAADSLGVVYFSDSEGVYKLIGSESEKIINGNYVLDEISPDNHSIVAFGNRSSNQSNLWKINTKEKSASKISFLPKEYKESNFEGHETLYYLVNDELFMGSINNNNFKEIAEEVDSYWVKEGTDFVSVYSNDSIYFVSKENYNKKPMYTEQ